MIQGLATPAHMKLQLIPILQHMHHDTSTAAMVSIFTSKKKKIWHDLVALRFILINKHDQT